MKKTAVSKSDLELLSAATDEDLMAHTDEGRRLRKSAATLIHENAKITEVAVGIKKHTKSLKPKRLTDKQHIESLQDALFEAYDFIKELKQELRLATDAAKTSCETTKRAIAVAERAMNHTPDQRKAQEPASN